MRISRVAALAASIFVGSSSYAAAVDFSGMAVYTWTYKTLSSVSVGGDSKESVGAGDGPSIFETDDPNLKNIVQHCLGTDKPDGISFGVCRNFDPSGDGWSEAYNCKPTATPNEGALVSCEGTSDVIDGSGTGKFAKMSGKSTYKQDVLGFSPDGVVVGVSSQTYALSY